MMRGDYIFMAKWTLIVAGATGVPGMLATLVSAHGGGIPTYIALTLLPSHWIFRLGWVMFDNFILILVVVAALHVLMVFVIVLALNMVLRRRREPL